MLVSGGQGIMHLKVTYRVSRIADVACSSHVQLCSLFCAWTVCLLCFLPLPLTPSLMDLVSTGLVSISTDMVSVTVLGGWLPLVEPPWIPAWPTQGMWLKACCSPWNHCLLKQAPCHLLAISLILISFGLSAIAKKGKNVCIRCH